MKFSNLLPSINFKQYMIMKYPEFFQTVRELKMTISDSFLPLYISILELCLRNLPPETVIKKCVVRPNLTTWDMTDVSYFILVGMYKWQNFTYMNTRSVTLGFFNDKLDPVNSIRFDKYELTEINFSGDTFNPYQQNSPCYHVKDTSTGQSLSIEQIPLANFQQVLNTIWEAENKE